MDPIIHNIKDYPAGSPARLISADDNPPLVTLSLLRNRAARNQLAPHPRVGA